MTQWVWDGLIAYAGGVLALMLSAIFDWLDRQGRYQDARHRILGAMDRDKTYKVDVEEELANQGFEAPEFTQSVWRTCMQALLTLMIVVPSGFWFHDALGASLAMKAVVLDLVPVFALTVVHEFRWKRERSTRPRALLVAVLWGFSLFAILLLASATRPEPKPGVEEAVGAMLTITRKRGNSVKFTGERQLFTGEVPLFTGEEGRLSAFCCGAA